LYSLFNVSRPSDNIQESVEVKLKDFQLIRVPKSAVRLCIVGSYSA